MNERSKERFSPAQVWTSAEVADLILNAGHNDLAITWPAIETSKARIKRAADQLRSGRELDALPIFGQCYRLRLVEA